MPRRGSSDGGPARPAGDGRDARDDDHDGADDGGAGLAGGVGPDIATPIPGTLADLLDAVAARFGEVTRRPTSDGVDYVVRDRPFVRLAGSRAAFRLRPEIAAAAARTPDATISAEGPEWVSFAPARLDRYGADRATAWFELGHRLAAEAARPN